MDDGHGERDLLHLVVEIKGHRREDAKEKKATMDTHWVHGVNNLRTLGRWAFANLTEIYRIDADFKARVGARVQRHARARRPRAGRNFRLTPFRMCSGLRLPVRSECRSTAPQSLAMATSAPSPQKSPEPSPDRARAWRAGAGKTRV